MFEPGDKEKMARHATLQLSFIALIIISILVYFVQNNPNQSPLESIESDPLIPVALGLIILFFTVTAWIRTDKEQRKELLTRTLPANIISFFASAFAVYVTYFLLINDNPKNFKQITIWILLIATSFIAYLFLKYLEEDIKKFVLTRKSLVLTAKSIIYTFLIIMPVLFLLRWVYLQFMLDANMASTLAIMQAFALFITLIASLETRKIAHLSFILSNFFPILILIMVNRHDPLLHYTYATFIITTVIITCLYILIRKM